MAENKTLTPEEKREVIKDTLEWTTTIFHQALKYVGSKNMAVAGNVTGPDGKNYIISFKPAPTDNDTIPRVNTPQTRA